MFSRKIPASFAPNALSHALAARRARGDALLDLTVSNPTLAEIPYPDDAILAALTDARSLRYDPHPRGLRAAREAIAQHYRDADGLVIDPERIVLTASTSEAYAFVLQLLCDAGDDVLVPAPSYPLFDALASLHATSLRRYPLGYDGRWHIDRTTLTDALTERTRAIVCVHPNNPTGSFVTRDEAAWLDALCAARDLAIVSDEVFAPYGFAPDDDRWPTFARDGHALAFTLGGFSKQCGLPQMKLGWIVVSGPEEPVRRALERLDWIADAYLSVSAPVQHAASRWLAACAPVREAIRARTAQNLATLRTTLARNADNACSLLHLEGGWYATLRVPATQREEQWALELLTRDGVLVQPGYFYDFAREAYLVVSLLTPPAVFAEGIARIVRRCGT